MSFKALATSIGSFAPTLATMLGGPLAGTAVAAIVQALGLKAGTGAQDITAVIQTGSLTPEQLGAIRAADQHHAEIIGQQGIDLAKINADHETAFAALEEEDRASARVREIAVRDHIPATLAVGVTVGFFAVLGYVVHYGIRTIGTGQGGEAVLIMLGSLGTAWTGIISYYFGSSAGSAAKDKTLGEIAKS